MSFLASYCDEDTISLPESQVFYAAYEMQRWQSRLILTLILSLSFVCRALWKILSANNNSTILHPPPISHGTVRGNILPRLKEKKTQLNTPPPCMWWDVSCVKARTHNHTPTHAAVPHTRTHTLLCSWLWFVTVGGPEFVQFRPSEIACWVIPQLPGGRHYKIIR